MRIIPTLIVCALSASALGQMRLPGMNNYTEASALSTALRRPIVLFVPGKDCDDCPAFLGQIRKDADIAEWLGEHAITLKPGIGLPDDAPEFVREVVRADVPNVMVILGERVLTQSDRRFAPGEMVAWLDTATEAIGRDSTVMMRTGGREGEREFSVSQLDTHTLSRHPAMNDMQPLLDAEDYEGAFRLALAWILREAPYNPDQNLSMVADMRFRKVMIWLPDRVDAGPRRLSDALTQVRWQLPDIAAQDRPRHGIVKPGEEIMDSLSRMGGRVQEWAGLCTKHDPEQIVRAYDDWATGKAPDMPVRKLKDVLIEQLVLAGRPQDAAQFVVVPVGEKDASPPFLEILNAGWFFENEMVQHAIRKIENEYTALVSSGDQERAACYRAIMEHHAEAHVLPKLDALFEEVHADLGRRND